MIELKKKIKGNQNRKFKKQNIYFFRLRAEIKRLQNDTESNTSLITHYKTQLDILQRQPPTHCKIN
jgi:hypothetical protein